MLLGQHFKMVSLCCSKTFVSNRTACAVQSYCTKPLKLLSTITDVKEGLVASLEEEPREGGDLHLLCIANRHLYSDLSWSRITNHSTVWDKASGLDGELTEGQFSHTLHFGLKNLTAQDSGTYRCSATHLLTGEPTHLDTAVEVTGVSLRIPVFNIHTQTHIFVCMVYEDSLQV